MKAFRLFSMLTLVLVLGAGMTSCSSVSDADLQTQIQETLAANPEAAGVTVTVNDKVATLTGTVKDDATKAYIDSIVGEVKNVKAVVNNLEVVPPAPDYTALDEAINASLPEILKDYPKLSATVQDGVVTLTGEAKQADIDSVMQKISALNPVEIVNNATVKK